MTAAPRWLVLTLLTAAVFTLAAPSFAETVTFEVDVPSCTPGEATVYVRSNRLDPETFRNDALEQVGLDRWTGTFEVTTALDRFRYKYSHSVCDEASCVGIEKSLDFDGSGGEAPDRTLAAGQRRTDDFVFIWRSALVRFDEAGTSLGLRPEEAQVAFCAPYLSVSSSDGSVIVGYDAYDAGALVVEWGETSGYGNRIERAGSHRNHVTLEGLTAGSTYHYRVSEDGHVGEDHTFRAPPVSGDPFRFALVGDTQYYDEAQRASFSALAAHVLAFDPHLVVASGDMVASEHGEGGPGGWRFPEMARWRVFFDVAAELMARVPWMAAMGNHEEDAPYFWSAFSFPEPDAPAVDHYDFQYGSVHFTVLYTGSTSGYDFEGILESQSPWLAETLASAASNSSVRWKVVVLHRGPKSQGASHPDDGNAFFESSSATRPSWRQLFEEHGVDLVLAGHNHNFTLAEQEGIRFITSCSGAPLHDLREPFDATTLYAERTCTADLFTVGESTIAFEALREDGTSIDEASFALCRESSDCEELDSTCPEATTWSCADRICHGVCVDFPPSDGGPDGDADADADADIDAGEDADVALEPDADPLEGTDSGADPGPGSEGCGCSHPRHLRSRGVLRLLGLS